MKTTSDDAPPVLLWPGDPGYLESVRMWDEGLPPTNPDGSVVERQQESADGHD